VVACFGINSGPYERLRGVALRLKLQAVGEGSIKRGVSFSVFIPEAVPPGR